LRRSFAAAGEHNCQQNAAGSDSVLVEERVSRHGHNKDFQQDSGLDRRTESSNLATAAAYRIDLGTAVCLLTLLAPEPEFYGDENRKNNAAAEEELPQNEKEVTIFVMATSACEFLKKKSGRKYDERCLV
jgi:hypothetical protein